MIPALCLTYLDVFPLRLVVENVSHVFGEDLFSPSTGVDTHHGHTNGPRGVTNGHLQVGVVGLEDE